MTKQFSENGPYKTRRKWDANDISYETFLHVSRLSQTLWENVQYNSDDGIPIIKTRAYKHLKARILN